MPDTIQQPVARDWQADWDYIKQCRHAATLCNNPIQFTAPIESDIDKLVYWLQEYQKKNECHIEVQTAYSGLLCEYHNFKETFRALARKSGAAESRERTLKTAIKIAIDEYGQWQDKAAAAHIMFGALNEAINQVYGDSQMRGEDDAGSNSRVQRDQEDPCTQEG